MVVGDSGNPVFLIIDGSLVLLTVLTSGGGGMAAGTSVMMNNSAIQTAMANLGGGYQAVPADLSIFQKIQ